jgi:hypothetical protein
MRRGSQGRRIDRAVYNPGAHTHTSLALHDAIEGADVPVVELQSPMFTDARSSATTPSSHRWHAASSSASVCSATPSPSTACTHWPNSPDDAVTGHPEAGTQSLWRLSGRLPEPACRLTDGCGSRSGRMVSAPVQPARQPLHDLVGAARRPHHPPQPAAVAGRAPGRGEG